MAILTFDLWPWPSNLSEILSRSIPNFATVSQTVQPWECWLTDGHTHRHTDTLDRFYTLDCWRRRKRYAGIKWGAGTGASIGPLQIQLEKQGGCFCWRWASLGEYAVLLSIIDCLGSKLITWDLIIPRFNGLLKETQRWNRGLETKKKPLVALWSYRTTGVLRCKHVN